jgi:hypothetical protein
MGLATTVSLAAAVIAGTRVIGPLYPYLFDWAEVLPIPAIVAGAAVLRDHIPEPRHKPVISAVTIALTIALIGMSFRTIMESRHSTFVDRTNERAVAQVVERVAGKTPFTIRIVKATNIDRGALFLQLAKDGYRFHVDPTVDLYRGSITHAIRGPKFAISAADAVPPDPQAQPITIAGKYEIFGER